MKTSDRCTGVDCQSSAYAHSDVRDIDGLTWYSTQHYLLIVQWLKCKGNLLLLIFPLNKLKVKLSYDLSSACYHVPTATIGTIAL